MNFLLNLRVFIKTLNELLLIHLIGSDYVKYEYFSMLGYDIQRDFYVSDQSVKRSYYETRYKMIEGDDEFNSEQKERIKFLLSHHNNMNTSGMGYYYGGSYVIGQCNTATVIGHTVVIGSSQNKTTGGSQVSTSPQIVKTTIPIK